MRKIVVTLDQHLAVLSAQEKSKPYANRKKVPTVLDISRACKITRPTIYRFINNEVKHLNIEALAQIIHYLNKQDFKTELADVLQLKEGYDL